MVGEQLRQQCTREIQKGRNELGKGNLNRMSRDYELFLFGLDGRRGLNFDFLFAILRSHIFCIWLKKVYHTMYWLVLSIHSS